MDCGLTPEALAERYRKYRIFYPEQPSEGSERAQLTHMLEFWDYHGIYE